MCEESYHSIFSFKRNSSRISFAVSVWSFFIFIVVLLFANNIAVFDLLLLPDDILFHMKITESVTKSSHQDCGPCYLHLPNFPYT